MPCIIFGVLPRVSKFKWLQWCVREAGSSRRRVDIFWQAPLSRYDVRTQLRVKEVEGVPRGVQVFQSHQVLPAHFLVVDFVRKWTSVKSLQSEGGRRAEGQRQRRRSVAKNERKAEELWNELYQVHINILLTVPVLWLAEFNFGSSCVEDKSRRDFWENFLQCN